MRQKKPEKDQKQFLSDIKAAIETRSGKLTWDEFATLAGVEPRTLKTYRMPTESKNYRQMPSVVRQAFEDLLSRPAKSPRNATALVPALAALVLSQAHVSLIDRQIITGLDRRRGARNGLTDNERSIMSMVSRFCLVNGFPDYGGEIHILLAQCTRPLESWLPIPEILSAGYGPTVLIHPEDGIPTPEAEELAADFSTLSAHIEEELFVKLMEALSKCIPELGDEYYARIREFIVRNPVADGNTFFQGGRGIPSVIWMSVQHEYYEPVPYALAENGKITLCAHCNNLMKQERFGLRCQSTACTTVHLPKAGKTFPVDECRRVVRGIRQYWVEPGIDEIRLFDTLRSKGLTPELYPHRDRVDLAIGHIGIDLKRYASPEVLGAKFRKSLGGLAYYESKWVVVPDWLVAATPSYLDRLVSAMGETAVRVRCLSLSDAAKLAVREGQQCVKH
ncbi:hypothetical protein AT959_15075 [Dechloromonas denitrificans]|uniref:REase associating with pPIWI RE domain-containing protein n=1 Tax=Dechloromonas denitrificans TaxID=281362 RepID=A0A133XEC8_9RHOO|nr:hypothetical protein [Dechloromonas denitrificans]KXB29293.1 hypothetical protein AT959_15075 [Dechloromonas denitrificans]